MRQKAIWTEETSHHYLPLKQTHAVRFEVLTVVTLRNTIFWDVILRGSLESIFQRNVRPPLSEWKELVG
jgi:hypothetical protein